MNTITVNLLGAGGTPPYSFVVINDAETTITASIAGSALTIDASAVSPGIYFVHVRITDAASHSVTKIIEVDLVSSTSFSILNTDINYAATSFPSSYSVPLIQSGGNGTVTWQIIPGITTLPAPSISGSNLLFTLQEYGQWTIGLIAKDSLQRTVTKVLTIDTASPTAYAIMNGHLELSIKPDITNEGNHAFTVSIQDSLSNTLTKAFNYQIAPPVSTIDLDAASAEHFWGTGDTSVVVFPIAGDLSGFTLGPLSAQTATNGLTVDVNPDSSTLTVLGPPTNFRNSEVYLQVPIQSNGLQVAILTREYTLQAHGGTTDIGTFSCFTRPYAVGDFVGLNPERPYFNAPSILKNASYAVRVQAGSKLPKGLSLDATTGLVYGTLLAPDVFVSVLEYVDASLSVHGTVTVNWDLIKSDFTINDTLSTGQLQTSYSSTITTNSSTYLSSASIYRGRLPQGMSLSVTGTSIQVSGTPAESGFFDIWIRCTNASSQIAYLFKRFVVNYAPPLLILTTSLPAVVTGQSYLAQLSGFGGEQPYVWSIISGTLPTGLSLNSASGLITGTTSVSSYSNNITFELTDARGVSSTATLLLAVNNTLRISTTVLPKIIPSQNYSFQIIGLGGVHPYTWALGGGSPALPSGITLSSAGVLSGVTGTNSYSQNIVVQLTDSSSTVVTATFALQVGTPDILLIDSSGVLEVPRGGPYQGILRVDGTGNSPYNWYVTPDSPNALPTGLSLATNVANSGITASITGISTAVFTNLPVKVAVIDSTGATAYAYLLMTSYSTLAITTNSLPNGTAAGAYSFQVAATGYNTPITWTATGLPGGYSISSSGLISGTTGSTYSGNVVLTATDSIGDSVTKTLPLVVQFTTLAINNTPSTITAGVAYSFTFSASGGTSPYTWAIAPSSASGLPTGLSLTPSTGVIAGTTQQAGFSRTVTFRVTDSIGNYVERACSVVVIAGLTLHSGIDYTDGTSTGYLGYVDNGNTAAINPNPNRSFLVVVTGVIATNSAQISVSTDNPNFTAALVAFVPGTTATFSITGNFAAGVAGDNPLNVSVTDSGLTVSAALKWHVYSSGGLRIAPGSGTLPIIYLN